MKLLKKMTLVVLGSILVFSLSNCKNKDDDHLGKKKIDELKAWSVPFNHFNGDETNGYLQIPAVDENDNIYAWTTENPESEIVSVTKDGEQRWDITIPNMIISRIAYKSGKLFFITDENELNNILYCLDASNGSTLWTYEVSIYCNSFAIKNNELAIGDKAQQNDQVKFQKIDFNGNVVDELLLSGYNGTFRFNVVDYYGNTLYVLSEDNNTFIPHIWKLSDNGSLSLEWDKIIDASLSSGCADLSIDDDGNFYLLTNEFFACFSPDGSIVYKALTNDVGDYSNGERYGAILTDSAQALISITYLYKISKSGILVWKDENDIFPPTIGSNGKYYAMANGLTGMRAYNSDKSLYWYSTLQGDFSGTLLHNGNYVFMDKGTIYCLNTQESGGLSQTAQWPKLFYDYGNTCYKNN